MKTPYDKSKKYVLRCGSRYIGNVDVRTLQNPLVDRAHAMVLGYRDNEQSKAEFFSILMGATVTPELL